VRFHSLGGEWLQDKSESHRACAEWPLKPLAAHGSIIDDWHPVVDSVHQSVRSRGDDRKGVKLTSGIAVYPAVPQPRKSKRLAGLEIEPRNGPTVATNAAAISSRAATKRFSSSGTTTF
jgi:hypothetical protein